MDKLGVDITILRMVMNLVILLSSLWINSVSGDCNTVFPNRPTFMNCQYRCHCKNDAPCDQGTGDCDIGCEHGWMGPGCQYRNIARNDSIVRNRGVAINGSEFATKAVDGDVNSCARSYNIPIGGYHFWRIQWNIRYRIVGLTVKIHPNDVGNFNKFRVETGSGPYNTDFNSVCYTHGDTPGTREMEIMCTQPVWTQHLRIIHSKQNVRMRVCEVEIYGGRAVTFNRVTNQTSTKQNRSSWLSVDGQAHVPAVGVNDTCSSTEKQRNPYWLVDFQTFYVVQSVYFYGGLPPLYPEYRAFKIFLLNDSSEETEIYKDTGLYAHEYQPKVIEQAIQTTARYLKIFRPVDHDVLAICEVIAFAECPVHKCGWDCTTDCYCATEITGKHQMDGVCPYGCSGRWTGRDQKCNIECNSTTWGHLCNNTCKNCNNCNFVTGHCEHGCNGPWYPPDCEKECYDSAYGTNCSQTCGHCKNNERCNMTNGHCTNGCMPGWQPPLCQEVCSAGRHSENCIEHCGHCNGSSTCNASTGVCEDGCSPGYLTSFCNTTNDLTIKLKDNIMITMSSISNGLLPEYAVSSFNGPRDPNTCKCCSGTMNAQFSWWRLDLRKMHPLKELHVYGAENERVNQLSGFSVYLGNDSNNEDTLVFVDTAPVGDNGRQYIISLSNRLARYVTFRRFGTLILCSVSLIEGECTTGYYGDQCEGMCHCMDQRPCDRDTGHCQLPVCKLGWTGPACNTECPFQTFGEGCGNKCFCKHGTCTKDYGICNGECQAGFEGCHCNEACSPGTFGEDCVQNCYCKNSSCTSDEGICFEGCQEGFTGKHCNEDRPGVTGKIAAIVGGCLGAALLIGLLLAFSIYRFRIYKREQPVRENYELHDNCADKSNETLYDIIDAGKGNNQTTQ